MATHEEAEIWRCNYMNSIQKYVQREHRVVLNIAKALFFFSVSDERKF